MDNDISKQIVQSFAEIAKDKDIGKDLLLSILEDVFRTMIRKKYNENDDAFEVIINADRGDIQILHIREVVPEEEFTNEVTEITLEDAQKHDPDLELYDEFAQELSIQDFGRRAVMMARQQLAQRIREIEKDNIFEEYSDRVGEIVLGDVYQVRNKEILVNHNGVELLLPKSEQIYKDRYRKGDTIRAVVKEVRRQGGTPAVIISRTSPLFLERLFENEIPEVYDGIIELVEIAREPGDRSKVAVRSHDERVDPVGACVGMKGIRIHAIVRELQNENIDVINYVEDKHEFIKKALQPAKVLRVDLSSDMSHADVLVPADEVSKAIGKGGVNIRLASKLTDTEIDVYREVEEEDDIDLDEFEIDFGPQVIELLHDIGCDTARAVLELDEEEIVRRTEGKINEDEAERIIDIIAYEFDDEQ